MKKCPFCGEEIQEAAHKCRFCGEWLDKQCPECGFWSRANVATCPECGFSFVGETKSEVKQEPQVSLIEQGPQVLPEKQTVESKVQPSTGGSFQAKKTIHVILAVLTVLGCIVSVLLSVSVLIKGEETTDISDFWFSVIIAVPLVTNAIMLFLLEKKFAEPLSIAIGWVASFYALTALCGFFDVNKWVLLVLLLGHCIPRGFASRYMLKGKQTGMDEDTTYLGYLWAVEAALLLVISCVAFFAHRDAPTLLMATFVVLIGWPIVTIIEVGLVEKKLSARKGYSVLKNLLYFLLILGWLALKNFRRLKYLF